MNLEFLIDEVERKLIKSHSFYNNHYGFFTDIVKIFLELYKKILFQNKSKFTTEDQFTEQTLQLDN